MLEDIFSLRCISEILDIDGGDIVETSYVIFTLHEAHTRIRKDQVGRAESRPRGSARTRKEDERQESGPNAHGPSYARERPVTRRGAAQECLYVCDPDGRAALRAPNSAAAYASSSPAVIAPLAVASRPGYRPELSA